MALSWVELAFPVLGLAGLCFLLRPGVPAKSLAPPKRGAISPLVAPQVLPAEGPADPPAM